MAGLPKNCTLKSPLQKERTILGFNSNITANRDTKLEEEWSGYAAHKPNPTQNSIRQILAGIGYRAPDHLQPPLLIVSSLQDKLVIPPAHGTWQTIWEHR